MSAYFLPLFLRLLMLLVAGVTGVAVLLRRFLLAI